MKMKPETIRVMTPQGLISAGKIILKNGEKIFVRRIRQKNIFRRLDGIPFLADGIFQAHAAGCVTVQAVHREEGAVYRITLLDLLRFAILKNFGYGEQLILPRKYFQRFQIGQGSLFPEAPL